MSTTWDVPPEPTLALPHDRPCPNCDHAAHLLPCGFHVAADVLCPCRDVPVPGIAV